jgi:chitinase
MRNAIAVTCLGAMLAGGFIAQRPLAQEIVGYYPSWQWYDREHKVRPATLPYDKLTVINFAFFKPNADGSLSGTDAWADEQILKGEPDWNTNGYKPNTSLPDLAHQKGVKVMVSIGGWTLSDLFPAIAADAGLRANFADACVKAIVDFGFDGIDIDWEYPGFEEHKGTPADKVNFTLLLQAIRAKLDAHGKITGKTYLLSAAMPAAPVRVAEIEMAKVAGILDFMNVMTYDFFGAWDPVTGHNSPLYSQSQGEASFSLDAAYKLYHETYGVPAVKINVGVGFYGRSFKGTALFGPHQGPDASTFSMDDGSPMYYNIVKAMAGGSYQRFWDAKSQVPYAVDAARNSMVSYDDPESVKLKAAYVKEKKSRGVIIWEITGDVMEDGSTPLLDAINTGFGGKLGSASPNGSSPNGIIGIGGEGKNGRGTGPGPGGADGVLRAMMSGQGRLELSGLREGSVVGQVHLKDAQGRTLRASVRRSRGGDRLEMDLGNASMGRGLHFVEVRYADGTSMSAKFIMSP